MDSEFFFFIIASHKNKTDNTVGEFQDQVKISDPEVTM